MHVNLGREQVNKMSLQSSCGHPPPGFDHRDLLLSPYIQLPNLGPVEESVDDVCERIYKELNESNPWFPDALSMRETTWDVAPGGEAAETLPFEEQTGEYTSWAPVHPAEAGASPGPCDIAEKIALSCSPLNDLLQEEESMRFSYFPTKVICPQAGGPKLKTTRLTQWAEPRVTPDIPTAPESSRRMPVTGQEIPHSTTSEGKDEEVEHRMVSNTAALKDIIGDAAMDSSQTIRKKLQSLVDYYHFSCNMGFGLIRVTNSFTIPDMNKSKDFCPKLHLSNESVLIEVYFPNTERCALFQAVDVMTDTGIPLIKAVDKLIVMEMDGGIDAAVLKSVTPIPLVPYFPEIPFMPVKRLANHIDKAKLRSKVVDEKEAFRLCSRLLVDKYRNLNMTIKWVEFQVDRKKLLIFAEFREYVTFSNYVKEVCFLVKNYLKKKHNTRYPLRIYIQRKLMQHHDIDFKRQDVESIPPCKPSHRRLPRISKPTLAVAVSS